MNWVYGVGLVRDHGDHVATVRDLPEVLTAGASRPEALDLAADALDAAVAYRIETGKALAPPSPVLDGEAAVELPLQTAAKASLYLAWRQSGLTKTEVAKRMGVAETEVRRILSPRHGTRLPAMEAAAKAMGARLSVELKYSTQGGFSPPY